MAATNRSLDRLNAALGTEEESEQNWLHPWAYSFMYADVPSSENANGLASNEIYLVAYCKNCRQGLTTRLSRSFVIGETQITQLDVPRFGCTSP